jgi:hypothetical protein
MKERGQVVGGTGPSAWPSIAGRYGPAIGEAAYAAICAREVC